MGIELTACAAELASAKALGANLSEHIHLDGGVDTDHLVILGDHVGIIHVTSPHQQYIRTLIHKIIEGLRSDRERRHELAWMQGLAAVIHRAGFPELVNAVNQEFRVNPKVAAVADELSQSSRRSTNAKLDCATIFDKLRYVPPDEFIGFVWFCCRHLHQGAVEFHKVIDQ